MPSGETSTPKNGRIWLGWIALLATIAVITALAIGVLPSLARNNGWLVDGGRTVISDEEIDQLQPDLPDQPSGPLKLTSAPSNAPLSAQAVAQAFTQAEGLLSGSYGVAIAQLGAEGLLYDSGADGALTPASTMKVMTSLAATDALGSQAVFTTKTVLDGAGRLILVGGGDPMLASTPTSHPYSAQVALPTTAELAKATAEALQAQGITSVSLGYDDTLFTGPVWHADWDQADRTYAAPISALVVDAASTTPDISSPSAASAAIFADQLRQAGIEVTDEPVAASGAGGSELASITSVPLELMVQQTLVHSDNFIAEMLLRQLALAQGQEASFDGGAQALAETLQELGVWSETMTIVDGSGLSLNNRLTASGLVAALQLAAGEPRLSTVLDGLPVAGVSGTMNLRFGDEASQPALGQVRAKTGTLNTVSSLAGYTLTQDGGVVVFAVIGNSLPTDRDPRPYFDHIAARLAACQCLAG